MTHICIFGIKLLNLQPNRARLHVYVRVPRQEKTLNQIPKYEEIYTIFNRNTI